MRLLWFNLATDADDPILGFTSGWLREVAQRVEFIHVITMRAGRLELPKNVRVHSVGKEKGFSEPRRAWEFYRHLFQILQTTHIDGCFSHMSPIFSTLAAPVLKVRSIPLVTWFAHPSLTRTLKLAHHLSDRMVSSLATAYPYRRDKLTVIGQGIDTDLFSPDGMDLADPPLILCVGRLSPVKDHPTLLKATALLRERWGQPFQVAIVGSPAGPQDEPYVRSLHQLVQDLDLQNLVSFYPGVPVAQLPAWYRRATVHVNLTPNGFGDKVAWEAMSCGRPCLAANEGFRETLGDQVDSLLFVHQEMYDLADKLTAIAKMPPEERNAMGIYLRQQVIKLHSLKSLSQKIIDIYRGADAKAGCLRDACHG